MQLFLFLTVCCGDVDAEFLATLFVSLRPALLAVGDYFADNILEMRGLFSWLVIGTGGNVFGNLSGLWSKILLHPFLCDLAVRAVGRSRLSVDRR